MPSVSNRKNNFCDFYLRVHLSINEFGFRKLTINKLINSKNTNTSYLKRDIIQI